MIQGIPAIIDGAVTLFMAILDAIPQIVTALVEAAPEIVQGIVTGLTSALPQIPHNGAANS